MFKRKPQVTAVIQLEARLTHRRGFDDTKKRLMSFVLDVAVRFDRTESGADLELIDRDPIGFLSAKWKIPGGGLGMRCLVDGSHSVVKIQAGAVDSGEVEVALTYRDKLKAVIDSVIETNDDFVVVWLGPMR